MSTPAETNARFTHALNVGDLETAVALYEPDAVFQPAPDAPTVSGSAIREALRDFFALKPTMTGEVIKVHETGEIALLINRWRMTGTRPDGGAIEMTGTSADVLRRRAGGWGILVDDPWGAAV